MQEGGGRWVGSNKVVELKKKKRGAWCAAAHGVTKSWNLATEQEYK